MTTSDLPRPPGRPFFHPAGGAALAAQLEQETRSDVAGECMTRLALHTVTAPAAHTALARLEELGRAVRAAADLYGDLVFTAVAGDSGVRLFEIDHAVHDLDQALDAAHESVAGERAEVARLEAELAVAQEAFDSTREVVRGYRCVIEEAQHAAEWGRLYTETLVAFLAGRRSFDSADRIARRAATRSARHRFRPDDEGTCGLCGDSRSDAPQHQADGATAR